MLQYFITDKVKCFRDLEFKRLQLERQGIQTQFQSVLIDGFQVKATVESRALK